ncbi:hypothetical protein PPL_00716 [Heterostelium album PN500]|uniref:Uncharacterized protein n=1 Tax=Heterostelium pallidum (strain ATCC 26659 / Pp 5 / PN500) TaxID=670386 RepID=D3AX85_HETP5|nr:hypothetical protein PPL_00716 [Heterostelium album PN500]EFA86154.1 hypothetical protein PPL_00716 [Heterostelium album PN500]|eukprot:XP_020438259.1 hypothetical protein PPL_00716 [Heterostelium album PN500]
MSKRNSEDNDCDDNNRQNKRNKNQGYCRLIPCSSGELDSTRALSIANGIAESVEKRDDETIISHWIDGLVENYPANFIQHVLGFLSSEQCRYVYRLWSDTTCTESEESTACRQTVATGNRPVDTGVSCVHWRYQLAVPQEKVD